MDQVEVEIVETQSLERLLERAPGVGLPGVLDPQLGGDEQVVAGEAAAPDSATDRFFVEV